MSKHKKQGLFRKSAIEQVSSPEQLDQVMVVTSPRRWIALSTVGVVVLAVVLWAFLGRIPITVEGVGILLQRGGIVSVVPVSGGQILDLKVSTSDHVAKGQVVATIAQYAMQEQIKKSQSDLEDLEKEREEVLALIQKEEQVQAEFDLQRKESIEETIKTAGDTLLGIEEQLEAQRQLLDEGLITKQRFLTTQNSYYAEQAKLRQSWDELKQLAVRKRQEVTRRQRELTQLDLRINEQQRAISQLQQKKQADSNVVSLYQGEVIELMASRGDYIGPGSPILRMEVEDGTEGKILEAVIFTSAAEGKKVRSGMDGLIAPSTVNTGEFGQIKGVVESVDEFPSTSAGMMRILSNKELVRQFSIVGAPIAIYVELNKAPTESGYQWTSQGGFPFKIYSGTLCAGKFIVEQRRPIHYVAPFIKKHVLGERDPFESDGGN